MPVIHYNNHKVNYLAEGQGEKNICLLHGYLESSRVWDEIIEELSKKYRVIAVDLPGHGQTDVLSDVHTMELMADVVDEVIKAEKIEKFYIVGHSMGGYVSLEYMKKHLQKLEGLCLFHSTPFADDEDRKKYRDQLIELIKAGKHITLAKEHVDKTFSNNNKQKFETQIGYLKVIAIHTPAEGAIAALSGMKQRHDNSHLLQTNKIPILWILGDEDNFISVSVKDKIKLSENTKVVVLSGVGHQGFIEDKKRSLEILENFFDKK